MPFGGDTAPTGWLFCDGQAVSRTEFADLFNVIGTKYGEGDGSTTFNVPNMLNRVAEGASAAGGYLEAGLPNITGVFDGYLSVTTASGAFVLQNLAAGQGAGSISAYHGVDFNASRVSSIYGNSDTVQMAATKCRYIIKFAA